MARARKPLRTRPATLALAVLLLGALTLSARAAVVLELGLPELVKRADHIVVALALEQRCRWHADGRIVTDATLRVEQTLKGDFKVGQRVVVTRLGGKIGNLRLQVPGSARFYNGRSAVVFLRELREFGELRVVGMSQGVWHITEDNKRLTVIPGGQDLSLVHRDEDGSLTVASPSPRLPSPAQDLLSEIRRLVAQSNAE